MRRAAALACLATIAVADHVIHRRRLRWILVGLFDHPAHVATAGLVLVNLGPRSRGWQIAFLAGSLLPDVDHLPLVMRRVRPTVDDPRPLSHCLAAVAPVAGVAAATGNPRLAAAAAGGMLAHFARDLGVGTGVPLLWPASRRPLRVPYPAYAAACMLLAARAACAKPPQRATLEHGL
jgi:membrane-bound metal-dependent hydrolase YbcI (DUF457 family)